MDLKISTSRTVLIGPFISETDGITRQTALSLVASDCRISKNGANVSTPTLSGSITHAFQGHYYLTFAVADVNTAGTLELIVYKAGSLPVFHNFDIMSAIAWDNQHGTGTINANIVQIGGSPHDGGGWALVGRRLHLSNDVGPGFIAECTGGNNPGALFKGAGLGAGALFDSGLNGNGVDMQGMRSGLYAYSNGDGNGILALGDGADNAGIFAVGVQGNGFECAGDTSYKDISAKEIDNLTSKTISISDKLPITGLIAGQNDLVNIQNNTFLSTGIPGNALIPSVPGGKNMIPITIQLRDETGNPEDPDADEIAVQARFTNAGAYSTQFFDNETGTVAATASTVFTPSFYKAVKESTGVYKFYFKVIDTDTPDSILFTIGYKEAAVTNIYTRTMSLTYDTVGSAVLANSVENRTIIANALKDIDVSATSITTGSIMSRLVSDLTFLISKMPASSVSDFGKTTLIDGVSVDTIFQLLLAMVNGKIVKDSPTEGDLTFFRRDNTTVLTTTRSTNTERNRVV